MAQLARRDVLRLGALTVFGVPALSACGGGSSEPSAAAASGRPRPGGTLRVAVAGGGGAETLDPFSGSSSGSTALLNQHALEPLVRTREGKQEMVLARSIEAAPGGGFVITLIDGVTFHDGSPLRAEDVLWTFRRAADPKLSSPYMQSLTAPLDLAKSRVRDARTLEIAVKQPVGDPVGYFARGDLPIMKQGWAPAVGTAIGTGPYRITAFTAGRSATGERHAAHRAPALLERLEFLAVDDPAARVNAVLGGQADLALDVPYAAARAQQANRAVALQRFGGTGGKEFAFILNSRRGKLADPRVRRALRLATDRQALVGTALLGFGTPNTIDVYGQGQQFFPAGLPGTALDVEQARRLLAEAGATDLAFTVTASPDDPASVEASTLWAEQLKPLGVTVTVRKLPSTQAWAQENLATVDAIVFNLPSVPLRTTYTQFATESPYPFHLTDGAALAAVRKALEATDDAARTAAWQAALTRWNEVSNLVVWGVGDAVNVAVPTLTGARPVESGTFPDLSRAGFTA